MQPVLLLVISALLCSCAEQPDSAKISTLVDTIVARLKGTDPVATEFLEARKVHFLDFDQDGTRDAIVFFTIEGFGGGNNYSFYMSALRGNDKGYAEVDTLRIGAKGMRHINFAAVRLEGRLLAVETSEYRPDDPMCCPSKPATARFEIRDGNIRELAGTPR